MVSKAVVIAIGVRADGHREILGVALGNSENETSWTEFFRDLVDRGLHGVQHSHAGLRAAIAGAGCHRCRVDAKRNLLAVARHQHGTVVSALISTIFAEPDGDTARAQLRVVVDQLAAIEPRSPNGCRP